METKNVICGACTTEILTVGLNNPTDECWDRACDAHQHTECFVAGGLTPIENEIEDM